MIKALCGKEYRNLLLCRDERSYKGAFGTLGMVCGSVNYQGAAAFATSAALHTGVGIAVAFIPDAIYVPFASKISGAVIEPLLSQNGMVADRMVASKILSRKCNAILFGSGIGISDNSAKALYSVAELDLPMVIDGDGLTLLSKDKTILSRNNTTVITPHIAEFSRLLDKPIELVRKNRILYATEFSKEYNCIVVLKDYVTVIANPDGRVYTLSKPTSALSKGGSGDVLAGMLSSFISQGVAPFDAAICAVTLHNDCGHYCAKHFGAFYSQPENLIESISYLLK